MRQASAPTATPRQPRLRSSCDGCGAAKLRCDRNHPECGRCRALGFACVYGISRKFGKPQRGREAQAMDLRAELPGARTIAHTPVPHKYPSLMNIDKFEDKNGHGNLTALNFRLLPGADATYDYTQTNLLDGAAKSEVYIDPGEPSFLSSVSLDLDEWIFSRHQDNSLWNPKDLKIPTSTRTHWRGDSMTHQPDKIAFDKNGSAIANTTGHTCTREAHDLLISLPFDNTSKLTTSPLPSAAGTAEYIPLDHILRTNREAIERLFNLLNCSCAGSPHLALLYASIFSRVLSWYQQAAGIPTDSAANMDIIPTTLSRSASTDTDPLTWSSAAVTPDSGNNLAIAQIPGLGVMHTQMAMGTFNVDNRRAQATLNLQLVLSEIKRASCVIDAFTSRGSHTQASHGTPAFGGVDGLYKSLGLWMKSEHTRMIGIIRSRLRELSDNVHS
ncbi:hypothetical protein GGR53DRAFT_527058 [Hypoxylon sp. FL1150]|nr:hypothetical protein GGR53DRAFT_527058 [Hypoxylon sp. FL1150]